MEGRSGFSPRWVVIAAVLGVFVALRLNLIDIPLERDEGAFGYVAQVINSGGLPYRDAVDHKPPVVYYIYASALRWMEPSAEAVHLFAHAYNLLSLIVLFFAARLLFDSIAVGFWTALTFAVFSAARSVQGFSATTELFMLLPISLSLLTGLISVRREEMWWLGLSGAFGALACWTKPVAATSVLSILLFLLVTHRRPREKRLRAPAAALLAWLVGGLLASLLVVAPFMAAGATTELFYWTFEHNVAYSGQGRPLADNLAEVFRWFGNTLPGEGMPLVVAAASALALAWHQPHRGLFLVAFLLLSLLGTIPGHNYPHYFMQLAPAVALAAGFGLDAVTRFVKSKAGRFAASVVVGGAVVVTPILVHPEYYWTASAFALSRSLFGGNPFPESIPVAKFLKDTVESEDRVFVYGSEAQVLFLSERRSATRFILMYPLFRAFPRHREFQREAWASLESSPPAFIVVTNVSTSFIWDGKADPWFETQVLGLLRSRYRMVAWIPVANEVQHLRILSESDAGLSPEINRFRQLMIVFRRQSTSHAAP